MTNKVRYFNYKRICANLVYNNKCAIQKHIHVYLGLGNCSELID